MKEKIIKRKAKKLIKEQISNFIKEQSTTSFKASDNDPSKSCIGRGVCCIDNITKLNVIAPFKIDGNRRVTCKCPKGSRKVMCEE